MKHLSACLLVLMLFITSVAYGSKRHFPEDVDDIPSAQLRYIDYVYVSGIKSVELYNTSKEQSMPIYKLGSGESIRLAFDDLRPGTGRTIYYSVEHCDANWNSSLLSPMDYLESFAEDQIINYNYSFNTFQKYIHYELKFPNMIVRPKISGNYLLKVYENGDPSKLLLTKRFYVLNPMVGVHAEVTASSQVDERAKRQKLNLSLVYAQLTIQDPNRDIKVFVLQNRRYDVSQTVDRPSFFQPNELLYEDPSSFDFEGSNQFRHFDIRSLRFMSDHVSTISRDSTSNDLFKVVLLRDIPWGNDSYSFNYDEHGKFYIRNTDDGAPNFRVKSGDRKIPAELDASLNSHLNADYANIFFSFITNRLSDTGNVYIVGAFNNYQISDDYKMIYNGKDRSFTISLLLKQGVYDYHYVWVDNNKIDNTIFDGSFFETSNNYEILVYYRQVGARWDDLVGFNTASSAGK